MAAKKKTTKKAAQKAGTKKTVTKKTSKASAPTEVQKKVRSTKNPLTKIDNLTIQQIDGCAKQVYTKIVQLTKPSLRFPVRSLSNVRYDRRVGHFQLGRSRKERTLTKGTVKSFAQTLKLMAFSKEMVVEDDFATKREAYYISKNWGSAKFKEQPESDTCMDDIEALFSLEGLSREHLRFFPEDHGGTVVGPMVVVEKDPQTGKTIETDCASEGSLNFTIPHSVENFKFRTTAKFVLAIETSGMFKRLHANKFWEKYDCILISMQGVPTRATRRFIRKLSDDIDIPVYAFVDCDPYGISNIYRTLKVGSGNAAHLTQFFCAPRARFLGVTPQDILDYRLEDATHPLNDKDIKRAKDALKNDPFFKAHKPWQAALNQMLEMGVRAEQQALAKWGLNFVVDEYLPRKLRETGKFLP